MLPRRSKTDTPRKKPVRVLILACACAAACAIALNIIVIQTAKPLIITAEEAGELARADGKFDCVLVLGASVMDGAPSPMLADRLDRGMELFALGVSDIMLLSGDNGAVEYNEVQAMKNYALQNGSEIGLTEANIYLDHAGFSTYDSAIRCRDVFQAKRVVIVTQRYHLYRAVYNAKALGLNAVGVAAEDTKTGQTRRDIREFPARVKDFVLTTIGAAPKIMGDPVPLTYPSTQN